MAPSQTLRPEPTRGAMIVLVSIGERGTPGGHDSQRTIQPSCVGICLSGAESNPTSVHLHCARTRQ